MTQEMRLRHRFLIPTALEAPHRFVCSTPKVQLARADSAAPGGGTRVRVRVRANSREKGDARG